MMIGIYNGFTGPQRMKAYRWLMDEYESGRRVKPTRCDVCLQTRGHIEPHSEDYSPPYGDHIGRFGLCYRCHMICHCRFRNPDAFAYYCQVLRDGNRFEPLETRNFPKFLSQHRGTCKAPIEIVGNGPLPGFEPMFEEGRRAKAIRTGQRELL